MHQQDQTIGLPLCFGWNRKSRPHLLEVHSLTYCRPLDALNMYHLDKSTVSAVQPTRYAVRQVLEQELRKEKMLQNSLASQHRAGLPTHLPAIGSNKENEDPATLPKHKGAEVKRDFFGRIIQNDQLPSAGQDNKRASNEKAKEGDRVWVSFNEGFSNAVRKPITLKELMEGF